MIVSPVLRVLDHGRYNGSGRVLIESTACLRTVANSIDTQVSLRCGASMAGIEALAPCISIGATAQIDWIVAAITAHTTIAT